MRLFIWNQPYSIPFGGSIVYAVAENVKEARKLAAAAPVNAYGFGAAKRALPPLDINRPPDAVHKLPYAEIYEWSE